MHARKSQVWLGIKSIAGTIGGQVKEYRMSRNIGDVFNLAVWRILA